MCGIAGLVDRSGSVAPELLSAMLDQIYHRGPDGEGAFLCPERAFAIGMRRLSIIDLQSGDQPIWNEAHDVGVVFNGEIYNYKELTRSLEGRGHIFRTRSDTEVLVHLYEEYGQDMVQHLRGMFAFCIFDLRNGTLLLARDHFGQKPLYYTKQHGKLAFASEISALRAVPWVDLAIDREAFLDYTCWLSLPPPRTHYRNILKLPAGCCAQFSLDSCELKISRYWQFGQGSVADLVDERAAIAQLDTVLGESISMHLRADVPVGVLLSSGLDSFAILNYAQEIVGGSISTFSVGFDSSDSELNGAELVARQSKSRHHALKLNERHFVENLDRVLRHLGEPIGDPACFAVLLLCELARNHVKVLLSGEGSDELFAGYEGRYLGAMSTLDRSESLRMLARVLPSASSPWETSRWQRLLARVHSSSGQEFVNLRSEGFPGDARQPRGHSRVQRSLLFNRSVAISEQMFRHYPDRLSSLLAFDMEWQLPESLLQKADKMSMGASIELRAPFLDVEVARLAARVPSELKLPRSGPGKRILRRLLKQRFPDRHVPLVKKGFPIPLQEWMTGPLREQVEDELFSSRSTVLNHLDPKLLRKAWNDFLNGWEGARVFYSLWLYERWTKEQQRKVSVGAPKSLVATVR
ncbi:asparagine synthase (glutamine-hydrolyzing) [Bradyrhizobium guangxiense]|uniref:asparagine synthase (glutamine-hydrolyzing) n=1 Tax=Bradyrhizobium guangxiense TaxID=1325115 RepID=UPI001008A7D9|nr:asparagine synthase (glutamine-hydrolyzing) [Bradyrhizobium guangxiense]